MTTKRPADNPLATATPVEIDTKLAALYFEGQKAEQGIEIAVVAIRRALGQQQVWQGRRQVWTVNPAETVEAARSRGDAPVVGAAASRTYADLVGKYDAAVKALADVEAAQQPLEAEYVRRGRWSRFFTVSDGHVHSSMTCSTCNRGRYATRFGWNADLSGTTEADAVAKLGPALCTVCFPSAPVEWTAGPVRKTRDEIAAERETAKAAAMVSDPKLIADVDGTPLKVDGDTLRTVRSAEIKAVDALVWAAHSRHIGEAKEANALRHETHTRKIAAALAHKNGTTTADELARITAKAVKKIRKESGADVAAAAAAVWAEQATPPADDEPAGESAHVVAIDSKQRVKAVAWLARYHRHAGARAALRDLATAVGVECRGGRIYPPRGWTNNLATGWDRFIDRLSYNDSDIRWLSERMADHGRKTGATVTIEPALAAEIRALRGAEQAAPVTVPPAPLDVNGKPIRVGALVECVGALTGVLTGWRGRVTEASAETDGPGRVVLSWPRRPNHATTARSANRVRLIDPSELAPATIGRRTDVVHAYDTTVGEAGCGYRNPAEARVVNWLPVEAPITCTAPGCALPTPTALGAGAVLDDQGDAGEVASDGAAGWAAYRRNHPEVLANWRQQNGRAPSCECVACDPHGRRTVHLERGWGEGPTWCGEVEPARVVQARKDATCRGWEQAIAFHQLAAGAAQAQEEGRPVVDADGVPVDTKDLSVSVELRLFFLGRVRGVCGHYLAASEARAGFTTCEWCRPGQDEPDPLTIDDGVPYVADPVAVPEPAPVVAASSRPRPCCDRDRVDPKHPRSDVTAPWRRCGTCGEATPQAYLGRERYGCVRCALAAYHAEPVTPRPALDQVEPRVREIHESTIAAGFVLVEVVDDGGFAVRWRYQHADGRTCFTIIGSVGVLLDTTADLTGRVDSNSLSVPDPHRASPISDPGGEGTSCLTCGLGLEWMPTETPGDPNSGEWLHAERDEVGTDGCGCPVIAEVMPSGGWVDGSDRTVHRPGCRPGDGGGGPTAADLTGGPAPAVAAAAERAALALPTVGRWPGRDTVTAGARQDDADAAVLAGADARQADPVLTQVLAGVGEPVGPVADADVPAQQRRDVSAGDQDAIARAMETYRVCLRPLLTLDAFTARDAVGAVGGLVMQHDETGVRVEVDRGGVAVSWRAGYGAGEDAPPGATGPVTVRLPYGTRFGVIRDVAAGAVLVIRCGRAALGRSPAGRGDNDRA
jgi:hypothetical protein